MSQTNQTNQATPLPQPILNLANINKSFTGNRVLNNITLSIDAGEILCLVGENGCGKSTLIKIISGVYQPDSGAITLNGKEFPKLNPVASIKQGVQVIYQDFSVFPNLSVAENISLGTQLVSGKKRMSWGAARTQAQTALDAIGVQMDLDEEVGCLSVAQKQIVAISRAILQDAKLIIMDEPTTALTQVEIEHLYDIIRGLSAKGVAVIFVSHKLDEVFTICQRIAVIRSGKLVVDEYAQNFQREKLVYYMTGQEIAQEPFKYTPTSAIPVLEVENLTQPGAFYNISFSLFPGEILGITGQLGSGRTELAKALFGIGKTHGGTISVHGKKQRFKNIRHAMACRIAYVPEDRLSEGLFMERSLTDNFNAPTIDRKKTKLGLVNFKKMADEAVRRITELNINAKSINVAAGTFSGGNQQRIVIGKWLASDPEILILNGPSVGVDVKSKSEIHAILRKLAAEGLCIIMISDDIPELMSCTNRVLVMNAGRLVYQSNTSETDETTLAARIVQAQGESEVLPA